FHYSDTWQLVINTGTTIVTFLMVFLIQRAQNKDSHAIHLKLNELVAAMLGASNRLINVESLTEDEIKTLQDHYCKLVELAKADGSLTLSPPVEEAAGRHQRKKQEKPCPAMMPSPPINLRTHLQPGDLGTIVRMHGLFYAQESGFDPT